MIPPQIPLFFPQQQFTAVSFIKLTDSFYFTPSCRKHLKKTEKDKNKSKNKLSKKYYNTDDNKYTKLNCLKKFKMIRSNYMTTCSLYIDDLYSDDKIHHHVMNKWKKICIQFNLLRVFQILVDTLMHIFIIVVNSLL